MGMPAMPDLINDRYKVGEVIGRGGMATVHQGEDLRLGRLVAIKVLRPELAADDTFHERFQREAQAVASLNHHTIVSIYDTGEITPQGDERVAEARPVLRQEGDGEELADLGLGAAAVPGGALAQGTVDLVGYVTDGQDGHGHLPGE